MEQPRSILVIQTAFIGDVILSTAIVESLHKRFPQTPIDFLLRRGNESLLEGHPFIRTVLVFDKKRKWKDLARLIKLIRRNKYDVLINVQRFATTGIITLLSGARQTIGFRKNPFSLFFSKRIPHQLDGRHEVERNQQLIAHLTEDARPRPALYPTAAQFEKVAPFKSKPFITISPASVWFTKQFPANQWITFLKIVPVGFKIYLLGAGSDSDLCNVIVQAGGDRVVSLAGALSLLESAALMKDARMNYVNDSAPMHLASALNAPVSAIYCSTVPSFGFGPLSDDSHIIETKEKLTCRPCGLHGFRDCPQGHFNCATGITSTQLLGVGIQ